MSSPPASPRSLHGVRTQLGIGVPMRDGVKLSTDLYQPDAPGPFPVILIRTPYGNNVEAGVEDAVYFAQRGYAVAIQDVRGRFDSEGDWSPVRPRGSGRLRRAGVVRDAAVVHREGRARAARRTSRSPSGWRRRSATGTWRPWRPGSGSRTSITTGSTPAAPSSSGFNLRWGAVQMHTRTNRLQHLWMPPEQHYSTLFWHLPLVTGDERAGRVNEFYREWIRHPDYGPYWERLGNVEKDYAEIDVPAYGFGGWYDVFLQGTLNNFMGVRAKGRTERARRQKVLIGPWIHSLGERGRRAGRATSISGRRA